MELKKRVLRYYQTVLDVQAVPEAGADMIVPDLYPDMARIVDAGGLACIKEKNLREDRLDISGLVRIGVLYEPDGDHRLRKLDINIPFNHVFDGHFPQGSEALCEVRLRSVEARDINPRKVSVLCGLHISCTVYVPAEMEVPDEAPVDCEVRKKVCTTYMPADVVCKSFTMNEDLEVPGSRPAVDEILRASPRLSVTDAKTVGNKIILKGVAILNLLYLSAGEPVTMEQEYAISQIIEMRHLTEGAHTEICLGLTGIELDARAGSMGETRQIGVSLHIEAQCIAWLEQRMETVVDLYSTKALLRPQMEPVMLTELSDRSVRRQAFRELVEVDADLRSVVDSTVILPPCIRGGDEGFSAEAFIKILYLTEEGEYRSVSHRMPVVPEGTYAAGTRLRVSLTGELLAAPTQEGIELRFNVDFESLTLQTAKLMVVAGVTEEEELERRNHPSVVLRRCRENEALWDIAKGYRTTIRDLLQCNTIDDAGALPGGLLLLIPRKRS